MWQAAQFIDIPAKGPGNSRPTASVIAITGSPAGRGEFTWEPLWTKKNWAKRVSWKSRSPIATSAGSASSSSATGTKGVAQAAVSSACSADPPDIAPVLFSPVQGELAPDALAEWILADRLPVRMQMQLHKILWGNAQGR